jgi:hypothetical protein
VTFSVYIYIRELNFGQIIWDKIEVPFGNALNNNLGTWGISKEHVDVHMLRTHWGQRNSFPPPYPIPKRKKKQGPS